MNESSIPDINFEAPLGENAESLDWNPFARKLEILACKYSHTRFSVRMVSDDRLHLISPLAHPPCENCSKAYCRACHPLEFPRCHWPGVQTAASH